jgi:hypothetical protein
MIILTCQFCGSNNVAPNGSTNEAVCHDCGTHLYLWNLKPVYVAVSIPQSSAEVTVKVSEQNCFVTT